MLKFFFDIRNIVLVEFFVECVVEQYQIVLDIYGNILIIFIEVVNNVIIYGNSNDEFKIVQIQLRCKNNCLAVCVIDEGEGFDFIVVFDLIVLENLLQVGGCGVFFM